MPGWVAPHLRVSSAPASDTKSPNWTPPHLRLEKVSAAVSKSNGWTPPHQRSSTVSPAPETPKSSADIPRHLPNDQLPTPPLKDPEPKRSATAAEVEGLKTSRWASPITRNQQAISQINTHISTPAAQKTTLNAIAASFKPQPVTPKAKPSISDLPTNPGSSVATAPKSRFSVSDSEPTTLITKPVTLASLPTSTKPKAASLDSVATNPGSQATTHTSKLTDANRVAPKAGSRVATQDSQITNPGASTATRSPELATRTSIVQMQSKTSSPTESNVTASSSAVVSSSLKASVPFGGEATFDSVAVNLSSPTPAPRAQIINKDQSMLSPSAVSSAEGVPVGSLKQPNSESITGWTLAQLQPSNHIRQSSSSETGSSLSFIMPRRVGSSQGTSLARNERNANMRGRRPYQKKPGGWLTKEERKAMRPSNSPLPPLSDEELDKVYKAMGWESQEPTDWNAPNQLVDWEGKILPAPVEWSDRRRCQRDNWAQNIIQYVRHSQTYYVLNNVGVPVSTIIIDAGHKEFLRNDSGDIALKDWVPQSLEGQTLQSYWEGLQQTKLEPVDPEDTGSKPFWMCYEIGARTVRQSDASQTSHRNATAYYLEPQKHIVTFQETPDPNDDSAEGSDMFYLWRKSRTQTSDTGMINYFLKLEGATNKDNRKRRSKLEGRREVVNTDSSTNPNNPEVNIMMRPLDIAKDAQAVLDIYQHWVNETTFVSELQAPDLDSMIQRLRRLEKMKMPMIVAVPVVDKAKKNRQKNIPTSPATKILGFAIADDDEGCNTQMCFVANVKVFVHDEHLRDGVGRTLLDRMLWLLDPFHSIKNDVKWKPSEDVLWYTCPGGSRFVGIVRISLYYSEDDRAYCEWHRDWLSSYGFKLEGDFSRVGQKLGKWTRQAVFQKETGCMKDASEFVRPAL